MSESLYTINSGVYVFKTLAAYEAALSAGSIPTGATVGFDTDGISVRSGAGAPTSSTPCITVGDVYYDTTNDCFYECKAISVTNSVYTFTWKQVIAGAKIGSNAASIDAGGNILIPLANTATSVIGAVHANDPNYGIKIENGQLKIHIGDWSKFNSQNPNPWLPIASADFLLALKKYLGVTITSSTSNTTINDTEAATMRAAIGAGTPIIMEFLGEDE